MKMWDEFGPQRGDRDDAPPPAGPADLVAYVLLSRLVGSILREHGMKERNWTRFRLASSLLDEIQSGEVWSMNRRRKACGCHSVDFRERLAEIYDMALARATGNSLPESAIDKQSPLRMDAHRPRTAESTEIGDEIGEREGSMAA